MKKYMIGNWKMNQSMADIDSFFKDYKVEELKCVAGIAPQALHISTLITKSKDLGLIVGAQNTATELSGAFTGETSAHSLKDLGASFALVGHSERRSLFKEDHAVLNQKLLLNESLGLINIFCVGEQLNERENGMTDAVVKNQLHEGLKNYPASSLDKLIVAYEPVWAIGTGKVATPEQAEDTHAGVRSVLVEIFGAQGASIPLLYGGSVKPANAEGLLSNKNIDGALVGGASLKGSDFSELVRIASLLS